MTELSLHILDIAQNAVAAKATEVAIRIVEEGTWMTISIADNGRGMSPQLLKRVRDPFTTTRTTRKVGLGIPLFAAAAEATGGGLTIESELGKGTRVTARFQSDHIDCMPLGDMGQTMATLISMSPDIDFIYEHIRQEKGFSLSTKEMRRLLGSVPLSNPEVMLWVRDYVAQQEQSMVGGTSV